MKQVARTTVYNLSFFVTILLTFGSILTACNALQGNQPTPMPSPAVTHTSIPPSPTPVAAEVSRLFARLWLLTSYGQVDQPSVVPPGLVLTLAFDPDTTMIGRGPCNTYKANYQTGDSQEAGMGLQITSMISSNVDCLTHQEIEADFLNGLQGAKSFLITEDGRLEISYTTTSAFDEKLVFTQGQVPLQDTLWHLETYGSPDSRMLAAPGTTLTAVFTNQGQLVGFSGCNAFSGSYTVDNDGGMTIAELLAPEFNCELGMEQETHYRQALPQATSYHLQGANLEIRYNDGEDILKFSSLKTPLERTLWKLIAVNGAPPHPAAPFVFQLAPNNQPTTGTMGGLIGCNNFLADFDNNETGLVVQNLTASGRACPSEGQSATDIYKAALLSTPSLKQIGSRLVFDSLVAELVFASDQDALEGPSWQLFSLGQITKLTPAADSSDYRLAFMPDSGAASGLLRGSSGCNNFSANYANSPGSILVGAPELTENTACSDALLNQERQYLSGLTAAKSYRVFGNILVLPYTHDTVINHIALLAPLAEQVDISALNNSFWFLRSMAGQSPRSTALVTALFTINSDGLTGSISGSAGCNTYTGSILQDFTFAHLEVGQN
ncbi:META domain-containing protein, partial [Chloroflexota bacterium]